MIKKPLRLREAVFQLVKNYPNPLICVGRHEGNKKHALLGIHSGSVFLWKTLAELENYVDKRGYKWYHNGIVTVI